jgi:pimeloyl-ACP methyl ester carboxylesterase
MTTADDDTGGASGTAKQSAAELLGADVREGYAEIGDQRLHYVEAGEGPLIVLLHGFPEFWYGWRLQIKPLAAAGYRVVAPDLRGYNLSSKPDGVAAYDTGPLVADVHGLIQERGADSALLVGHDWGGTVAWATAMNHPEVVQRLAILNAAHPRRLREGLHHPGQLRRSWSFFSTCQGCPRAWCTLTAGISSGTSWTTPARPIRRRRWTATSRRGRSRGRQPG